MPSKWAKLLLTKNRDNLSRTKMLLNIIAVIVTYGTEDERLNRLLSVVNDQCAYIVADNTDDRDHARRIAASVAREGGHYLCMGGNQGIGAAQNAAIALAWKQGADSVLLLDDDSIPAVDFVARIHACSASLGHKAVVGAIAVDSNGREISNARHIKGLLPKCREMMSSGALIPRVIFERVGSFDNSLFIDCVDFDWGWRANRLGIALYLCRESTITHRLGDGRIAGVRFPAPIRHYYQYRNTLQMMVRAHTPFSWTMSQILKLPTKLLLIAILMPEKRHRLWFAITGIRDAIRGRNGPWPGKTARVAQDVRVL